MCILLVEDDDLVRETILDVLRERNIPVHAAENGDVAALMIENPPRRFSVLLTDFHMPGSRHGCDVAAHMHRRHPHVHLFIVTGRPDVLEAHCGSDLQYEVLLKPLGATALISRVEALVEY